MKVKLIDYSSVGVCESSKKPYDTVTARPDALAKRVFDLGHRSIGRHGNVVFEVDGLSQDALRQLSRHPHVNLTVKSARYCSMEDVQCFTPTWLQEIPILQLEFEKDYELIMRIYAKWRSHEEQFDKKDTAKLFLPLASTTSLYISGNFQSIYEFLQLRLCTRAQEEIRELANRMLECVKDCEDMAVSTIIGSAGCKGDEYRICPEHPKEACGKYPHVFKGV